MRKVYQDLDVVVEDGIIDGERVILVTVNVPYDWHGRAEYTMVQESFRTDAGSIVTTYADAVERFAEIHDLDLWDNIDNMKQELSNNPQPTF